MNDYDIYYSHEQKKCESSEPKSIADTLKPVDKIQPLIETFDSLFPEKDVV